MTQAIDLDALKRDLKAAGYLALSNGHSLYVATHTPERLMPHCRVYNDGDVRWREERRDAPLREIIARHVATQPMTNQEIAQKAVADYYGIHPSNLTAEARNWSAAVVTALAEAGRLAPDGRRNEVEAEEPEHYDDSGQQAAEAEAYAAWQEGRSG